MVCSLIEDLFTSLNNFYTACIIPKEISKANNINNVLLQC